MKYIIRTKFLAKLLEQLEYWRIGQLDYQMEYDPEYGGQVMTTYNTAVVDVALETFIKVPHWVKIERVENK